ncbi:hypothetical protein FSP39_007898 [Pinctada imbricata]|uniref:Retrotransposon gag domain-containing protein n=1 Tax=Pinctada imbricata TaxID=66713 RepID=A0AA88Y3R7_PINIB|nr:hypothetical protein FSP39_007898 [Pinctada imbricata]
MDLSAYMYAPKPFCGDYTENAEEWIRKYELYLEAAAFNDEDFCKIITLILTADAFTWYRTLTQDVRRDKQSLIESFLKKFGKTYSHNQEQMGMFMDEQQQPNETETDFKNDVHCLTVDLKVPAGMMRDKSGWHCAPEHLHNHEIEGRKEIPNYIGIRDSRL